MSDEQRMRASGKDAGESKKPYMLGYVVRPYGDGKASWSRVAVAWAHKDDQGFDVRMDAVPVDGRLVLRTVRDDDRNDGEMIEPEPTGMK